MSDPNYELLQAAKRAKLFLDQLSNGHSIAMDKADEIRHDLGVLISVVDAMPPPPQPEFHYEQRFTDSGDKYVMRTRNPLFVPVLTRGMRE